MNKSQLARGEPFVIAEVGVNHNGSEEMAVAMTEICCQQGVDAVKFQLFNPSLLVNQSAEMAGYQKDNIDSDISQREMLGELTISASSLERCKEICDSKDVEFICTAFDAESLDVVLAMGVRTLKWPSGELNNYPFLQSAARSGCDLIISTGMADTVEISEALETCFEQGMEAKQLTLLHCTSQYPTPDSHANIFSIPFLSQEFGINIGFSDHTLGFRASELALAAGATVFEKHVTLSRELPGPDHKASLNMEELGEYVSRLRTTKQICGEYSKRCFDVEFETKAVARKSLHAAVDIPEGALVAHEDIMIQRPGNGIEPKMLASIVGRRAARSIKAGALLAERDFLNE